MSQVTLQDPFKGMRGKVQKDSGFIMRKKKFRAPSGKVMREGVQESYKIVHPRDYAANPPKGEELANITIFGQSKQMASEIIRSERYTEEALAGMPAEERAHVEELRAILEDYRERFYAQFKRPDPEAPFEKKPRPGSNKLARKQYSKLDNFIQAIIREKLKQNQGV